MDTLYFDYNATTPVASEVQDVICSTLKDTWGNPSSSYEAGKKAKLLIEDSRLKVGQMIGAEARNIIFTSGGTEANNMVIHSVIKQYQQDFSNNIDYNNRNSKPHIITTNIEHDSVKLPLEKLVNDDKADVSYVPVSKLNGRVNVDDIFNEMRPTTCLVSVMLANNETGIIQPVSEIGSRLRAYNKNKHAHSNLQPTIYFHTDAAQAIGKIDIDVTDLGVDYLTIVGHKFYGPRIGALYFKPSCPLHPMFYGGGQERHYRPGTENTCMIAGLGKAAELVNSNVSDYEKHMTKTRDYLEKSLKATFGNKAVLNNCKENVERLPNTVSIAFNYDNITGAEILSSSNISASTGAACHSNEKPSEILTASGVSAYLAARTLRLSVGRETTIQDIDNAIQELQRVISEVCTVPDTKIH